MEMSVRRVLESDPEFAFLVACCRWPADKAAEAARAQRPELDWARLHRLARRHRVEGLLHHATRGKDFGQPAEVAEALSAAATKIVRESLIAVAESRRLQSSFAEAGIDALFVKGLTLAQLAYGTIAVKSSHDVDLLVARRDVAAAAPVLNAAGYTLVYPTGPSDPERVARWHGRAKESVWRASGSGIELDLHSALVNQPMLAANFGLGSARQDVQVARGIELPTLADEELFAYLCLHGASSAWFRLKWLADLAAFLSGKAPGEVERLYREAARMGAARAAGAAMILCAELFALGVEPRLLETLRSDRMTRFIVHASMHSLAGRVAEREVTRVRFGTAWIHLAQFALVPGLKYKLQELRRQIGEMRRGAEFEPAR